MSDTAITEKERANDQFGTTATAVNTTSSMLEIYSDTLVHTDAETASHLKKVASDLGKFGTAAGRVGCWYCTVKQR